MQPNLKKEKGKEATKQKNDLVLPFNANPACIVYQKAVCLVAGTKDMKAMSNTFKCGADTPFVGSSSRIANAALHFQL